MKVALFIISSILYWIVLAVLSLIYVSMPDLITCGMIAVGIAGFQWYLINRSQRKKSTQ